MTEDDIVVGDEELETGVVEVEAPDAAGIEVEIVDDTPDEDKGRARAADVGAEVTEDEDLEKHSASVQKRIKKLKFEFHEERRRKETAEREREAAIQYAGMQKKEAERLRKNLSEGEEVLVNEAKVRVASQLTTAKRAYKEAYDAGDSDALLDAQTTLSRLQFEEDRVQNWRPAKAAIEQQAPTPQAAPQVPKPSPRAQEWAAENQWFDNDNTMRRYAILVHEELVESGVDSTSEAYYTKINEAVRARYPDRFADVEPEVRQPQRKAGSVVAPGGRSVSAPRNKVVLNSSEATIATRLGLTFEQYAAQKLKDMKDAHS